MQLNFFWRTATLILLVSCIIAGSAAAQQYKIRQSTGMMGMNSESTVYVKGMRKRTEPGKTMGMQQPTTIEQCDLQRTIKINDKKKLYFIEPFAKPNEEVIDEDAPKTKPVTPAKPATVTRPQKGGVIEMWYTITDTGERKQMYGFTARHIWTYQKLKPSADACYLKDSMIIKTDGWYIDLPQFNCPVHYDSYKQQQRLNELPKPDCQDRYVNHRKGKGKLGFPLMETRTIIMGGAGMSKEMGEISTTINTVEFSAARLDSMLFEIPLGYTETKNEADLQEKMNVNDMMKEYMKQNNPNGNMDNNINFPKTEGDMAGLILVGVMPPTGGDGQLQAETLQELLVTRFTTGKMKGIAVSSAEEAKSKNCTYLLTSDFAKMKQTSKVGGLLKAIKNADPNAATSFTIETNMMLTTLMDNSVRSKQHISDKFEGKPDDAAGKALNRGATTILNDIR
jgi:hypothetical protein